MSETIISRDDLRAAMAGGQVTVVDALPAAPYERRHLPGALNLIEEDAAERASTVLPDPATPIVTYSSSSTCGRGELLATRLTELGYSDVRVYKDGIEDWAGAGLPLDSGPAA